MDLYLFSSECNLKTAISLISVFNSSLFVKVTKANNCVDRYWNVGTQINDYNL